MKKLLTLLIAFVFITGVNAQQKKQTQQKEKEIDYVFPESMYGKEFGLLYKVSLGSNSRPTIGDGYIGLTFNRDNTCLYNIPKKDFFGDKKDVYLNATYKLSKDLVTINFDNGTQLTYSLLVPDVNLMILSQGSERLYLFKQL